MRMKMTTDKILGLGNDIIEVERIRQAAQEERFLARLFTEKERTYCLKHKDPAERIAGRFAAKEAIVKALGCGGFGENISWLDIEILNDEKGKPEVFFSEVAKKRFGNPSIMLSISHCESFATAVAIWFT